MRPRPARRKRTPWTAIVALGGTALVLTGAVLGWLATRPDPAAASASTGERSPEPVPAPTQKPLRFDADDAFDRAKTEALRWSPDAVLSGMEIGPFLNGQLQLSGKLRAEFGKPVGAHVGPGAGLSREILVVTVTNGTTTQSTKQIAGGIGIADPNCIVQDVWRKALPEGVDADRPLKLRYERSPRDQRSVWRILGESSATPLRVLDGANCSFLVR